jgi:tRNA(fMet)-specific endonuclease VapC
VSYVLDTNAVSAIMRGEVKTVARLQAVSRSEVLVPNPVIAEIAYGIARLPRSKRKDALRARLESIKAVLPRADWSDAVSDAFGEIKSTLERRGTRIEDFDAAIAAHAYVREAILVTANVEHMVRVPGLLIEDWSR